LYIAKGYEKATCVGSVYLRIQWAVLELVQFQSMLPYACLNQKLDIAQISSS